MKPLILVDEENLPRGTATWEEAHGLPAGKLHRAFSVYVFRKIGEEILIQRRSSSKLFAGLWAALRGIGTKNEASEPTAASGERGNKRR